jgi:hypothetical protein
MYFHVDYPDLNRLENQASSMITGIYLPEQNEVLTWMHCCRAETEVTEISAVPA